MSEIEIRNKIRELVNKYNELQSRYNGDSVYSKNIEAEIDYYNCLLDK